MKTVSPQDWLDALAPFGTDWQKPFLESAPHLIVVFQIDYGLADDGSKIKHYYVQESVGIATPSHTPSPMGFLGQILERPANERPFLLIPVAYPALEAVVPVITKKPLSEVMVLR